MNTWRSQYVCVKSDQGDECSESAYPDPRRNVSEGCTDGMEMCSLGIQGILPHAEFDAPRGIVTSSDYQLLYRGTKLRCEFNDNDPPT